MKIQARPSEKLCNSSQPPVQNQVRLNKALADAGLCSRRKADELVMQGLVSVNGQIVRELGLRVLPGRDRITVNGKELHTAPTERIWLALHKPVQVVCTASDPEGRTTVIDILPDKWKAKRLFPVGRLDYFSEGLVLLTNDGEAAQHILHPRYEAQRSYHVLVREKPTLAALESMRAGMRLAEGEQLAPVRVRTLPSSQLLKQLSTSACLLEISLVQGLNRQIRRMCRDLGLTILRLVRVSHGPVQLGNLKPGEVRELTGHELAAIKKKGKSTS